ncbi:amidase [Patellaria atrata CBS 101060]|uniref:Amidase n=1 Tax=Patellaria atrata CBS 101060 TaxID=1346257 RepID=A0A9P4S4U4_9PEZI|nr:amidase [Patellaria atrata CBS 101060]
MASLEPEWVIKAQRKRQTREDAVVRHSKLRAFLSSEEDVTAIANVAELYHKLESGQLTASEVARAYIQNLTEVLFDDAIVKARELDVEFCKYGKTVGPLHGIPMTLKDQFNVKDYDSTIGYVGRAFKPAKDDAVLVKLLREMGAVIIAKTNLPQSIMWCETENPLWGLTVHPKDPDFTPGGSTGGEGALLALNGSLVGWGTDIGGSIRIPAHMLGLYGLKPSSGRLPYQDVAVSTEGQEHVPSVIGPLARSLSSIHLVTKAVINSCPWKLDPKCCPLPWREAMYDEVKSRPLVIGLLLDDGVVKVHPPIERVLKEVAAKLKQAGHEIINWDPADNHRECIEIMVSDGGEDIRREVQAGGEPFIPHVEALVNKGKPISVYEYWQLNKRKLAAQKRYMDKWNSMRSLITGREVDILLMPTMSHSAVPHRRCRWVGYTKIWNFLDYSTVVIPSGDVSKELDPGNEIQSSYVPRNDLDRWNWETYDIEKMDGMAISVQIVGRRLEEEKVLGVAQVIDDIINKSKH